MRQKVFWISASCILVILCMRPVFSSGTAPASKEKVLYSFTASADGGYPASDLTLDSEGNLYGTTTLGGTAQHARCDDGCGTVFELKRTDDGWKELVLYSFQGGKDGWYPLSGVTFDHSGNLFGTTIGGGEEGAGTAFELSPNSRGGWTERIIYSLAFNGSGGLGAGSDLVFDAQGNLYGTASAGSNDACGDNDNGCGAVFELTPGQDGSWTLRNVYTFKGPPDGGVPSSGVALDSAGNIYGATTYGGAGPCGHADVFLGNGCGSFYKLTPKQGGTWVETVLYSFVRGGGFGIYPSGPLLFDGPGHLFGVTQVGGDAFGTVFELQKTKKGWKQSEPHIFYGYPEGSNPVGRLVMDANGDIFGVTYWGGGTENGTVFELQHSAGGWTERILHKFSGKQDAANPSTGLAIDSQGHLFGTTFEGGSQGFGAVYEVTP